MLIYAALGEPDRAFQSIDRSCELRETFAIQVRAWDPHLDVLQADPRFDELLRRIRIPEPDALSGNSRSSS